MEEIHLAMEKATMLFPNSPIVLYGHSMGGNIAINFALREFSPMSLLIATSPWLKLTKNSSGVMNLLVSFLNLVVPSLQIKAPVKAEDISHDPEIIEISRKRSAQPWQNNPAADAEMNMAINLPLIT